MLPPVPPVYEAVLLHLANLSVDEAFPKADVEKYLDDPKRDVYALGVIAAEQWGATSGCGAIGALTPLETLAQNWHWQTTTRKQRAEAGEHQASPSLSYSSPHHLEMHRSLV